MRGRFVEVASGRAPRKFCDAAFGGGGRFGARRVLEDFHFRAAAGRGADVWGRFVRVGSWRALRKFCEPELRVDGLLGARRVLAGPKLLLRAAAGPGADVRGRFVRVSSGRSLRMFFEAAFGVDGLLGPGGGSKARSFFSGRLQVAVRTRGWFVRVASWRALRKFFERAFRGDGLLGARQLPEDPKLVLRAAARRGREGAVRLGHESAPAAEVVRCGVLGDGLLGARLLLEARGGSRERLQIAVRR